MGVGDVVAQKGTVRVSVAMISYNGAEFLRGQVESVLEQLGQEDELVVSDDGSTDGTTDNISVWTAEYGCCLVPGRGLRKMCSMFCKKPGDAIFFWQTRTTSGFQAR